MKEKGCEICSNPKRIGVDTFLHKNDFGVLVINRKKLLAFDKKIFDVKMRFSFAIHEHRKNVTKDEENEIKASLSKYIFEKYGYKEGIDFDYFITMNKYSNHWHIHA